LIVYLSSLKVTDWEVCRPRHDKSLLVDELVAAPKT
jgi:hypothetical protein